MSEYRKVMNRAHPLFSCQYWYRGEKFELAKLTEGSMFFEPLFYYQSGKGISIFYNFSDPKQDPALLAKFFNERTDLFDETIQIYEKNCKQVLSLVNRATSADINELFLSISGLWKGLVTVNVLGGLVSGLVKKEIADKAYKSRSQTDHVVYEAGAKIKELLEQKVPPHVKGFSDFILYEEFSEGDYPDISELEKRKKTYIYYKDQLITLPFSDFVEKENINLVDDVIFDKTEFSGQIAHKGKVTGRVKVIYEFEQTKFINDGDIIVTPMTTPDFLPAMKKASAFITDEGGITCHAAIVAREMKKPCIIGTKIATKVLKDGDMVEVDAEKGVVRIIK